MGALQTEPIAQTPFEAVLSAFNVSARLLAAASLNQPYSFFQIAPALRPMMFESVGHGGMWGRILGECKAQHEKYKQFTPRTVGGVLKMELSELAFEGADIELRFAFDMFFEQWGRVVELKVRDNYFRWFTEGRTSEEITALAHGIRSEAGLFRDGAASDGMSEFEFEMMESFEGRIQQPTVRPPISSLRRLINGYKPGDYIVVGALSGVGKSFYALNHIADLAKQDIPCSYVNLENIPKDVTQILFQMWMDREYSLEANALMSEWQKKEMKEVLEKVKKAPYRSVNPGRSLPAVLSFIRQERQERGIAFAAIDYAQLVSIPGYKGARNYELAEISAAIRCLGLELGIPIMAMVQLKQEVALRPDKRGGMYDIRDCANFAQDATHVQMLYRPKYFKIENDENGHSYPQGYADIHNVKGRSTGTALAECSFSHIRGFYDTPSEPVGDLPTFNPTVMPPISRNLEDTPF